MNCDVVYYLLCALVDKFYVIYFLNQQGVNMSKLL